MSFEYEINDEDAACILIRIRRGSHIFFWYAKGQKFGPDITQILLESLAKCTTPDKYELMRLSLVTGLYVRQIYDWFTNARRRNWLAKYLSGTE